MRLVSEVRIALVAHQPYVAFFAKRQDALVLFRRNHAARRIARRVHDQQFRLWRNRFLDRRSPHRKAVLGVRFDINRRSARVLHDVRKTHPARSRNDDLVALLNQHAYHIEDGVLAAHADDAFRRLERRMQFALVPRADRFTQRRNAPRGRVLRFVFFNRANASFLDAVRRGKVRLARPEVRHVDAFGLQFLRFGKHGSRR